MIKDLEEVFALIEPHQRVLFIIDREEQSSFLAQVDKYPGIINFVMKTPQEMIEEATYQILPTAFLRLPPTPGVTYGNLVEMMRLLPYYALAEDPDDNDFPRLATLQRQLFEAALVQHPHPGNYAQVPVYLVNIAPTSMLEMALERLGIEFTRVETRRDTSVVIDTFADYKEELSHVVFQVSKLIDQGVAPGNIQVDYLVPSYRWHLEYLFYQAGIPYTTSQSSPLISYQVSKDLLDYVRLQELVTSQQVHDFLTSYQGPAIATHTWRALVELLSVHQEYLWLRSGEEVARLLEYLLGATSVSFPTSRGVYLSANAMASHYCDHLFIVGANESALPSIPPANPLISDEVLRKYNFDTRLGLIKQQLHQKEIFLRSSQFVAISCAFQTLAARERLSPWVTKMFPRVAVNSDHPFQVVSSSLPYVYKERLMWELNRSRSGGSLANVQSLGALFPEVAGNYLQNRRQVGLVSQETISALTTRTTLSATAMECFYSCSFRFFLERLLRLDDYTSSPQAALGTLIHAVLACEDEEAAARCAQEEVAKLLVDLPPARKAFLTENYLKMLSHFYQLIQGQHRDSRFAPLSYERRFVVERQHFDFIGVVDKLMRATIDGRDYYLVVDYKSGRSDLPDRQLFPYGLKIQLPVYCYLVAQSLGLDDDQVVGLFLQDVRPPRREVDLADKQLVLTGLYNHSFKQAICGQDVIKPKKESDSCRLSQEDVAAMRAIVDSLATRMEEAIVDGHFPINPKEVDGKLVSCDFCRFKDICLALPDDVEVIVKGGEDDANDSVSEEGD